MVQAERDQRALHQPEDKGRGRLVIAIHHHGQGVDAGLNMLPDVRQQQAEQERQKRRRNRHKALAGEEAEEFRQLHGVEAVVAPGRKNTADQAAKDAHLQRRNANDHGVFPALRGHFRRDAQHGADGDVGDKHGDRRRECGNAGFRSQTDGRADGEQHRQVIKDNPAGVHHQRQMELIAEGQQQARSGKQ